MQWHRIGTSQWRELKSVKIFNCTQKLRLAYLLWKKHYVDMFPTIHNFNKVCQNLASERRSSTLIQRTSKVSNLSSVCTAWSTHSAMVSWNCQYIEGPTKEFSLQFEGDSCFLEAFGLHHFLYILMVDSCCDQGSHPDSQTGSVPALSYPDFSCCMLSASRVCLFINWSQMIKSSRLKIPEGWQHLSMPFHVSMFARLHRLFRSHQWTTQVNNLNNLMQTVHPKEKMQSLPGPCPLQVPLDTSSTSWGGLSLPKL